MKRPRRYRGGRQVPHVTQRASWVSTLAATGCVAAGIAMRCVINQRPPVTTGAPALGQHNDEVLRQGRAGPGSPTEDG